MIPEIYVPRSGDSYVDWNTKWQFDGEFFYGSIGSRTANEAHWHAVLLDTRPSPRWRPQYQEGACSEELRRCWNEASLCFSTATTLQVCRIGIFTDHASHTPLPDEGNEPMMYLVTGLQTRCEHREPGGSASTHASMEWIVWTGSVLWILPLLLASLTPKVQSAREEECKNPHLLSTMTDSARCTYIQSLSPNQV